MKITVPRQKIVEALSMVCRAIAKNSVPVLQYVYLTIEDNILTLRATNLDLTLIKTVKLYHPPEIVPENVSKLLPGPYVLSLLAKCPEDKVTFSWEKGDNCETFHLQFGNHKSQINNIPAVDNFPIMPETETSDISINGMDLEKLLNLSLPFTSNETPENVFNGVFLRFFEGKIMATATDRHRLAMIALNMDNATGNIEAEKGCIIPKNSLKTAMAGLEGDKVEIYLNDQLISFKGQDWQAIIRLIQDKYPDISRIIPESHQLKAECERESLMAALKLCSQVSDFDQGVDIHFGEQFSVSSRGTLGDAVQPFEGTVIEGESLTENNLDTIRLNWRYLYDLLKQVSSRYVVLETGGYTQAVIIYGKTQPANWEEKYLLMPMRREEIEGAKGDVSAEAEPRPESQVAPEESPEMEYVCGNCDFYESDLCFGNSPQPDEPCCENFHQKTGPTLAMPQEVSIPSAPEVVIPPNSEEEHFCGDCALFGTEQCESKMEYDEAPACDGFKRVEALATVS